MRDGRPNKFQHLVQSAIDANLTDERQDEVLGAYAGSEFSLENDLTLSGTFNHALPVANATPTSVDPMPVENAPSAP